MEASSLPPIVEFDLFGPRAPTATRRTTPRRRKGSLLSLVCTACGDKGTLRDPRLAGQAAAIHARTAHDGARARVRSVPPADA